MYKYLYYICRVKQLKFNHMTITEHTQKLKPLIDSASYLIKQIEICENELSKLMSLPPLYRERLQDEIDMWQSNLKQYYKSLKNVKKMIGNA